jgi:hypothetical protein
VGIEKNKIVDNLVAHEKLIVVDLVVHNLDFLVEEEHIYGTPIEFQNFDTHMNITNPALSQLLQQLALV